MYDFVGKRKIFYTISLGLLVVAILFALIFGVKLDIQFQGGTIITYSYQGELDQKQFQNDIEALLNGHVTLKDSQDAVTGATNLVVTLTESKGIDSDRLMEIDDAMQASYASNSLQSLSVNTVDPLMGREFFAKSLVAVAFASLLMIIYISIRFKLISGWSAGCMAVVALLHDVMVVFATFIICGIPLNDNFIAVVLTILGYSLNDTIVIYDRIRENKRIYGSKISLEDLVNKSINQSLSRAMATTFTTVTALAVVAIIALIYNVSSILSFAFPLIIGLLSGVYSSICLSGPLWVAWQNKKAAKKEKLA